MRFGRRQVKRIIIKLVNPLELLLDMEAKQDCTLTVYAHKDNETETQIFGIERCNTVTGELSTRQIQLAITDSHYVELVEQLEVEK